MVGINHHSKVTYICQIVDVFYVISATYNVHLVVIIRHLSRGGGGGGRSKSHLVL